MSKQTTLAEVIDFLCPERKDRDQLPPWPPDVFAICAGALSKSGGYHHVLTADLSVQAVKLGRQWRSAWVGRTPLPPTLKRRWRTIMEKSSIELAAVCKDRKLCYDLLLLIAASDEACAHVGLPHEEESSDPFHQEARIKLLRKGPSTLCDEVPPARVAVLPKMHTPQTGLTLRSLSHHLAICETGQISPNWKAFGSHLAAKDLNLLLIPWPTEIKRSDFVPVRSLAKLAEPYGCFEYRASPQASNVDRLVAHVRKVLAKARQRNSHIEGIVLPELALTPRQYEVLVKSLSSEPPDFLAAGVMQPAEDKGEPGQNSCRFTIWVTDKQPITFSQAKHHRWQLDAWQLDRYDLPSNLRRDRLWWEHTRIADRHLTFHGLRKGLAFCFLICEDLARPDPVGDLIRAVGPNLVIALLMDGPQSRDRWAARYATALTDDPGCSVLSLTSLGMVRLYRPPAGIGLKPVPSKTRRKPPSTGSAIALWRDLKYGLQTITMEDGAAEVVLQLLIEDREEWTADGRRASNSVITLRTQHAHSDKKSCTSWVDQIHL